MNLNGGDWISMVGFEDISFATKNSIFDDSILFSHLFVFLKFITSLGLYFQSIWLRLFCIHLLVNSEIYDGA